MSETRRGSDFFTGLDSINLQNIPERLKKSLFGVKIKGDDFVDDMEGEIEDNPNIPQRLKTDFLRFNSGGSATPLLKIVYLKYLYDYESGNTFTLSLEKNQWKKIKAKSALRIDTREGIDNVDENISVVQKYALKLNILPARNIKDGLNLREKGLLRNGIQSLSGKDFYAWYISIPKGERKNIISKILGTYPGWVGVLSENRRALKSRVILNKSFESAKDGVYKDLIKNLNLDSSASFNDFMKKIELKLGASEKDEFVLEGIMANESNGYSLAVSTSSTGHLGLMQLGPLLMKQEDIRERGEGPKPINAFNRYESFIRGAKHFMYLKNIFTKNGFTDYKKVVQAYNLGVNSIKETDLQDLPRETQNYPLKVPVAYKKLYEKDFPNNILNEVPDLPLTKERANDEIKETLKGFAGLTEISASNSLYRHRLETYKMAAERTHNRAAQKVIINYRKKYGILERSSAEDVVKLAQKAWDRGFRPRKKRKNEIQKRPHWPYLCAQYAGWQSYSFSAGAENQGPYREAWKSFHYLTGKKDAIFEGKEIRSGTSREKVIKMLEKGDNPKWLGLYYSGTGTGPTIVKSRRKYGKIVRRAAWVRNKIAKIKRAGGIPSDALISSLKVREELVRTEKVTDNSHMAVVMPKKEFRSSDFDKHPQPVMKFLNNYYGLNTHTKKNGKGKDKNWITNLEVIVDGNRMKIGDLGSKRASRSIELTDSILLEYFGPKEVRIRPLRKALSEYDENRRMMKFTPKFMMELKPKYRNLREHSTVLDIKKRFLGNEKYPKFTKLPSWPNWFPEHIFGDNEYADKEIMFKRAMADMKKEISNPPKRIKSPRVPGRRSRDYFHKMRIYRRKFAAYQKNKRQIKFYKRYHKQIKKEGLVKKWNDFHKNIFGPAKDEYKRVALKLAPKDLNDSSKLYHREKVLQLYHRYMKVTFARLEPGQKLLTIQSDTSEKTVDFMYEKLKAEWIITGGAILKVRPPSKTEINSGKKKRITFQKFFKDNFLDKAIPNITQEELDLFKNESPSYPAREVLEILRRHINPDSATAIDLFEARRMGIKNKENDKTFLNRFLVNKSDIFLKPKLQTEIKNLIQKRFKEYKEWKQGIIDEVRLKSSKRFNETFKGKGKRALNNAFSEKIIPNPYFQLAERVIFNREIGSSKENLRKNLKKRFGNTNSVGLFQVNKVFLTENISKFIKKSRQTYKLIQENIPNGAEREDYLTFMSNFKDKVEVLIEIQREVQRIRSSRKTEVGKKRSIKILSKKMIDLLENAPYLGRVAGSLMMENNWPKVKRLSAGFGVDYKENALYTIRILSNSHNSGISGPKMFEDYNRWALAADKLGLLGVNGKFQEDIIETHVRKTINENLRLKGQIVDKKIKGWLPLSLGIELIKKRKKGEKDTWKNKIYNWLTPSKYSRKRVQTLAYGFSPRKTEMLGKLQKSMSVKVIRRIKELFDKKGLTGSSKKLISDLKAHGFDKNKLDKILTLVTSASDSLLYKKNIRDLKWKIELVKQQGYKLMKTTSYDHVKASEIKKIKKDTKIKIRNINLEIKKFKGKLRGRIILLKTKKVDDGGKFRVKSLHLEYVNFMKILQNSLGIDFNKLSVEDYLTTDPGTPLLRGRYGARGLKSLR